MAKKRHRTVIKNNIWLGCIQAYTSSRANIILSAVGVHFHRVLTGEKNNGKIRSAHHYSGRRAVYSKLYL